jgi:hypothetical protein
LFLVSITAIVPSRLRNHNFVAVVIAVSVDTLTSKGVHPAR